MGRHRSLFEGACKDCFKQQLHVSKVFLVVTPSKIIFLI